jgi:hypothetical protein
MTAVLGSYMTGKWIAQGCAAKSMNPP